MKKPQPIPGQLVPLFSVPVTRIAELRLQRALQKICKRVVVPLSFNEGFHSFRHRIATAQEVVPFVLKFSTCYNAWLYDHSMNDHTIYFVQTKGGLNGDRFDNSEWNRGNSFRDNEDRHRD
jgi:hypothetical protein